MELSRVMGTIGSIFHKKPHNLSGFDQIPAWYELKALLKLFELDSSLPLAEEIIRQQTTQTPYSANYCLCAMVSHIANFKACKDLQKAQECISDYLSKMAMKYKVIK